MSSRRWIPQARGDLLWAALSFAVLQLGLAVAIACWLPQLRDPSYGYRIGSLVRRSAEGNGRATTVVMLGSSRTAFGLRAARAGELVRRQAGRPVVVFNFGTYGAGPVMELVTLKRLRAAGVRPDLLLVEVSPFFLAGQEQVPYETSHISTARLTLDELRLVRQYGPPGWDPGPGWCQAWPVPWYTHRFALLSWAAPTWLPAQLREDTWRHADDSGTPEPYRPPITTAGQRQQTVERVRRQFGEYLSGFRVGGPGCRALRDLLELGRAEQIPMMLVLVPEGTAFRSWYPPAGLAEAEAFLAGLSREFGAPLVDARGWVDDDGFSDSHHMLPEGGEAFSERLAREVLGPALERTAATAEVVRTDTLPHQ
jgi:hypothetical protein